MYILGTTAGRTLSSQEVLGAVGEGYGDEMNQTWQLKQIPSSHLFPESMELGLFPKLGAKPLSCIVPAPDNLDVFEAQTD